MISPCFHGESWPTAGGSAEGSHAGAGQGKRALPALAAAPAATGGIRAIQCLRFLHKTPTWLPKDEVGWQRFETGGLRP